MIQKTNTKYATPTHDKEGRLNGYDITIREDGKTKMLLWYLNQARLKQTHVSGKSGIDRWEVKDARGNTMSAQRQKDGTTVYKYNGKILKEKDGKTPEQQAWIWRIRELDKVRNKMGMSAGTAARPVKAAPGLKRMYGRTR